MTARSATSTGGEATPGPARRERHGPTGTRATRVIGVLALLGLPLLLLLGLVTSPPDVTMGDSVRIMYVHVPSVWMMLLGIALNFGASIAYLIRASWKSDALAEAGAEVVGVAVLADRGARSAVTGRGLIYRAAYELADLGV